MQAQQLVQRLEKLTEIGRALSSERDIHKLLETILVAAKDLVHADAGTLYLVEDNVLRFAIIRTDSLGIAMGGTSGQPIAFPPVPLYDPEGSPNTHNVVACAVINAHTINIEDAYTAEGYDFTGTRNFDSRTGYRSQSFLTVPLKNHEAEIIGVLQLINAQNEVGQIIPFDRAAQQLVESLASQAAIALTNRQLITQLEDLFEAFINVINTAIDDKSPYTGGHCERVPVLTMLLAEAVDKTDHGPFSDFHLSEKDRYELKIAGLLHDCGKVTTPVHVVDKATKLQTLFDRIALVDARFDILRRDAKIALLEGRLNQQEYEARVTQLQHDQAFLRDANTGGEFMSLNDQQRVASIAAYPLCDENGHIVPFLSAEEAENLSIARGTLNAAERDIINHHIVVTIKMLESLPWPKHLRNVPEYAGGHHERMDGRGYPKGLTQSEMSPQARMMGVADIFEALTARDRPYKPGKTLSEALHIMARMVKDQHIDADLFRVFVEQKVYLTYAERFLEPEQIDRVDVDGVMNIAFG